MKVEELLELISEVRQHQREMDDIEGTAKNGWKEERSQVLAPIADTCAQPMNDLFIIPLKMLS